MLEGRKDAITGVVDLFYYFDTSWPNAMISKEILLLFSI
jgi:hypothetical protein